MVGSFLTATGFFLANLSGANIPTHISLVATVAITTLIWFAVTWLTPPTDPAVLRSFYLKVRPGGPGWKTMRAETGVPGADTSMAQALLGWVAAVLFVYAALFGLGSLLYGRTSIAFFWIVLFVVSGLVLFRTLPGILGRQDPS
jgi:hypothetical protein